MTFIQIYNKKNISLSEIRSTIEDFLTANINANQEVFESLTRMGNHYGGNVFPARYYTSRKAKSVAKVPIVNVSASQVAEETAPESLENRFSVVYLFHDRHQHVGCTTHEKAQAILQSLASDPARTPVGIYDDKTELFEWDLAIRSEFDQADIREQGYMGNEIISIAQALRRRDSTWESYEFRRPSVFS